MNTYTLIDHAKRHLDLVELLSINSFDKTQPTTINFTADVDGGWGEGHTVCLSVTLSPDWRICSANAAKGFRPYTTPPVILDGILFANQEIADKLITRKQKSQSLMSRDDFVQDKYGDLYKITGLADDYRLTVVDQYDRPRTLDPDDIASHGGWNWKGS